jgi:hypothetical protein
MAQMTWRAPDELLERVRRQAQQRGRSLNDWVTAVLAAASDPATASSEAERLRERLAQAGLLEPETGSDRQRPPEAQVAAARVAAGRGSSLVEHLRDSRR